MKKKISIWYAIIVAAVFFLAALVLGPVIGWNIKQKSPLNIWILDKTVPDSSYREHTGITWILDHDKIVDRYSLDRYHAGEDYYGFYPGKNGEYSVNELPEASELPDLIYLADTYGVYTEDGYSNNKEQNTSGLIYGGINSRDIFSIKNNIANGNTLIGEFNIAAEPTTAENRKELETIFGLEWSGVRGTYFNELSRGIDVPEGIIAQYEESEQKNWNYTGAGYVLISDNGKIAVLQEDIHIKKNGLRMEFKDEYKKEFGVSGSIPYHYWFEFTSAKLGREEIASFTMNLTEEGRKLMEQLGLSESFPAIIRNKNTQYSSYYFCGDFAEMPNNKIQTYYEGIDSIMKLTSTVNKSSMDYFYWNGYVPVMQKILKDVKERALKTQETAMQQPDKVLVKAEGNGFEVLQNGVWKDFFVKGVNIGAAEPGKWFTEFPTDENTYYHWFEQIAAMNANTIRVYTLLPPQFYTALNYYNKTNPDKNLMLFQEIWPEENPEDQNYLKDTYVKQYNKEIEYVIDAIHGRARIDERPGRAYGFYTADVSDYIIGYLVGRELEPDEVIATNTLNTGFSYQGKYVSSGKAASATEAWLAMNCDYVVAYEAAYYQCQHPVAMVSWPTLDVAEHDTEWNEEGLKSTEYNDKVSVDINHIDTTEQLTAGFFGAYHIYPNYPDFMNLESKYADYSDEEGVFRYGGYLKEFMLTHTKYPALVAEFGLPTGMGNAHSNPDGYHHGGLTEEEQGKGIVRMMKAIKRENYAGGLIFEWMDEWAKKTWTTEPFMIPYERHIYWHNAVDPEQNYGILAMEALVPEQEEYSVNGTEEIQNVSLKHDASYLYLDITLQKPIDFTRDELYIGLDTYDRSSGEYRFTSDSQTSSPFGLEFLIELNSEAGSKLLVQPGYNVFQGNFASYYSKEGIFEELLQLTNPENTSKDGTTTAAVYQNCSELKYGPLKDNNNNHWTVTENTISIRLPWTRLNFSDPSTMTVLYDTNVIQAPVRDEIGTLVSDGIMLSVNLADRRTKETIDLISTDTPYRWKNWTEPAYTARLKASYTIIGDYFETLN